MLVKYYSLTENELNNKSFEEGSIYVTSDTNRIYYDPIGEVVRILLGGEPIILSTESAREALLAPIPNKLYIILESSTLYIYNNSKWNKISDSDKMDKTNPTGTGSFSLNRKDGSTVGTNSHAEGTNVVASGKSSHAEGQATNASAPDSHAEGYSTLASGASSHAEGDSTKAIGNSSHAEGYINTANGSFSHAEGNNTYANGKSSHAEGKCTEANGESSHAEGNDTYANGESSHAEGNNTYANGKNSHVQGRYNIVDNSEKYAHIVGNGTSASYKSNAHTIDWNGLGWFAGGLKIGGTDQDDDASEEVAKKKYSVFYIVGNSTTAGTWTGTCDDITEYYEGLTIAYKTNIAGVSGGSTLNINGLGAVAVVRNTTSAVTTHFGVGSILMLTYTTDSSGTSYWKIADYDSDTKTRSSNKTGTKMFIIGASTQSTSGQTTYSNSNCYIGSDNCLYSGGEKVTTETDVNTIIDAKLASIAVAEEMSF